MAGGRLMMGRNEVSYFFINDAGVGSVYAVPVERNGRKGWNEFRISYRADVNENKVDVVFGRGMVSSSGDKYHKR